MDKQSIKRIEEEFGVIFPAEYCNHLIRAPFEDRKEYPHVCDFFVSQPETLLSLNRTVRKNGYARKPWPENFFIIGYLDGLTYFIDTIEDMPAVYVVAKGKYALTPKNMSKMRQYESIQEFIDSLYRLQSVFDTR